MTTETHSQLASFIWSICNLRRGPYKRNEYRKVILPLTVLRGFDCLLGPTRTQVLQQYTAIDGRPETVVRSLLEQTTGRPFYNLSKLDFSRLLDEPEPARPKSYRLHQGLLAQRAVDHGEVRIRPADRAYGRKNLLYEVIKAF